MSKNILIFADGTGQIGGMRPDQQLSNIYKLFRATRVGPDSPIDPKAQVAFYDAGLGTTNAAGGVHLSFWQRFKSLCGLAVGLGFSANVIDCYEAILKRYEPGDRIYLFGFSRGGYTVRTLANVLNLCGVPTTDGEGHPLPRTGRRLRAIAREAVVKVYEHGAGHARDEFEPQREAIARRFRAKYESGSNPDRADVYPEFVGVFDAVAALGVSLHIRFVIMAAGLIMAYLGGWGLGWLASRCFDWPPSTIAAYFVVGVVTLAAIVYAHATLRWASKDVREGLPSFHLALWSAEHYDCYLDPRIPIVRHALAIDETRRQFGRVEWGGLVTNADRPGDTRGRFRQRWFAGNHSDIGGSYPEEESRLSDIALNWMVEEATAGPHPILIDETKLHLYPDPQGPQHSEPFSQQQGAWWQRLFPWPIRPRNINAQAELDPSVLARFEASCVVDCDHAAPYRPEALRNHEKVAAYYK